MNNALINSDKIKLVSTTKTPNDAALSNFFQDLLK